MEKTDREIGAILEAIQAVTPEVAEQAVMYWQFIMAAWIGLMFGVILVAGTVFRHCWKRWDDRDYEAGAWISGAFVCIACVILTLLFVNLVSTFIAPDYYAAECMIELGRKALGG